MRDYLITWKTKRRDRKRVLEWVFGEWDRYADDKNDTNLTAVDKIMRNEQITGWWLERVSGYMKRAEIFGLDTEKGRQQAMKAATTCLDMLACMVRVYGDPPEPGEAS